MKVEILQPWQVRMEFVGILIDSIEKYTNVSDKKQIELMIIEEYLTKENNKNI